MSPQTENSKQTADLNCIQASIQRKYRYPKMFQGAFGLFSSKIVLCDENYSDIMNSRYVVVNKNIFHLKNYTFSLQVVAKSYDLLFEIGQILAVT